MPRLIYLAGPISGISPEAATNWREYVAKRVGAEVSVLDPTRDTPDYALPVSGDRDPESELARGRHGRITVARDRMDVMSCDIVLANLLGSNQVSIGTVGEIFWADLLRKPVLIVREVFGNPHDHDMLNAIAAAVYSSLEEAIARINRMLTT